MHAEREAPSHAGVAAGVTSPWRYGTFGLGALAASAAIGGALLGGGPLGSSLATLSFVLAPLAAGVAAVAARSIARPGARSAWTGVAMAAACATIAQLAARTPPSPGGFPVSDVFFIAFHVCLAEAAILALRPARDPRLALEIALDGLLVLLSAATLVLRYQLDSAFAAGWLTPVEGSVLLAGQIAVVGSLLFCALLVLWRDSEFGAPSIDLVFVAALLFSFGGALGGVGPATSPSSSVWIFDLIRFAAWISLTASAVVAWYSPGPTIATSRRTSVARRMRLMVIPAAVAFLAAWAIGGLDGVPASSVRRVTLAALALVLAVRVSVALFAVEHEANERQAAEARAGRARIRAITAQMNPHFLFNALHSVSALIRRDAGIAENVLERLGGLLRYALDHGDTSVRLDDEWRFTQSYLHLEQVRLGSRLSVDTDLDDDALDRIVPPFILQPLVENAIHHAIDPRPEGGQISIRAEILEDSTLRIEVQDNGSGADEAALWDGPGVGLRGVRAQLESYLGAEGRAEAARLGTEGFVVRLELPEMEE